jgi:hypothetical protein
LGDQKNGGNQNRLIENLTFIVKKKKKEEEEEEEEEEGQ